MASTDSSSTQQAPDGVPWPQRLGRWIVGLPGTVLIVIVRGYQLSISPWIGQHCRFTPSCSQYFIEAVRKYGAVRGSLRGAWRICRCHPFQKGGYDPP